MAWYDRFLGRTQEDLDEKLNPGQTYIGNQTASSREDTWSYERYYEELEIVNRGVNMLVDDAAAIPTIVQRTYKNPGIAKGVKRAKVENLLNQEPNPYQDINTFRRNLITDFLLDGNIFIYFDGAHLYHLPANKITVHADKETYVERYSYHDIDYSPSEIIHVKENSFYSIYRGVSRLKPAVRTM